MMEPCGSRKSHASHHYIASDSNGYWCEGFAATEIDPDAVMAKHAYHADDETQHACRERMSEADEPCEPYCLAEALAAEQAKVTRVRVVLAATEPKTPGVRLFVNWLHAAIADQPDTADL